MVSKGPYSLDLAALAQRFFFQHWRCWGSIPMEMKANLKDDEMTPADYHGKNFKTMIPDDSCVLFLNRLKLIPSFNMQARGIMVHVKNRKICTAGKQNEETMGTQPHWCWEFASLQISDVFFGNKPSCMLGTSSANVQLTGRLATRPRLVMYWIHGKRWMAFSKKQRYVKHDII